MDRTQLKALVKVMDILEEYPAGIPTAKGDAIEALVASVLASSTHKDYQEWKAYYARLEEQYQSNRVMARTETQVEETEESPVRMASDEEQIDVEKSPSETQDPTTTGDNL